MNKTFPIVMLVAAVALVVPLALAQQSEESPRPAEKKIEKSKDPVCKMMVLPDPDLSVEHKGRVYYFCMKRDLEAFEADPEKYLEGEGHTHPDPNLAGKRR